MPIRHPRALVLTGALLLSLCAAAATQTNADPAPKKDAPAAKRPITYDDFAAWRSIQSPVISPDGGHVAYAVAAAEGDGDFVVRNLASGKEHRVNRGGRPAIGGAAGAKAGPLPTAGAPKFTSDGKSVVFAVYPSKADKTKAKASAGSGVGVMDLATGKVERIEKVRGWQTNEDGPAVLAYLEDAGERGGPAADPVVPKGKGKGTKGGPAQTPTAPPVRSASPAKLVIRPLPEGKPRTIADVVEYSLTKDGSLVVYATAPKDGEGGVFAVSTRGEAEPTALRRGAGRHARLTWDEKQTKLAFFVTPATPPAPPARAVPRVFVWSRDAKPATAALSPAAALAGLTTLAYAAPPVPPPASELKPSPKSSVKAGHTLAESGGLAFSRDGSRLFVGVSPPPPPAPKAGDTADRVNVELWHYRDDFIQPMQKVRFAQTANRTFRAVYDLATSDLRQLTDDTMEGLALPREGDFALGQDDRPYRLLVGSSEVSPPYDAYLLNVRTGERKLVAKKMTTASILSPAGKYLVTFDGKVWHSRDTATGKKASLTAKVKTGFVQEEHDLPAAAPPYGIAGFTTGDTHAIIQDRYDLWKCALDGSETTCLTGGKGRATTTGFRMVRLNADEASIDLGKPQLLRAENETTRDTGFFRLAPDGTLKQLVMGARNYSVPTKAKKGDKLLLTVSTFFDYPDLFTADMDFREVKKISDANPQKANFVWGKSELIDFKTADGVPMKSILVKPDNFDPKKKYPMIVYIYERLTQNVHRFVEPRFGTSINPAWYASNGYLVLMPDIAYNVGYPGQSSVKCVLPAIQSVVDRGIVDEKAIGIQGHSWGGYQAAYLVTQTKRFAAAAAGAPVVNMTSAYGGIRWGSGLSRQFQYEKTQSRIGGTLWDVPTRFMENSPVFMADRVTTPLMMLHNDRDGAVPWYQGIEYYMALRRLGKEVYLFNYVGEDHGLANRANMRDYSIRMQQFFDHHLKGAKKPEWMEKGLAYRPGPTGTPGAGAGARPPETEGEEE